MKKSITLKENHRRPLTSTLMIVEQLLVDIEDLTARQKNTCCYEVVNDVAATVADHNHKVITEAHKQICALVKKYNIDNRKQSLRRTIATKKAKIWEILGDANSAKMNKYGAFPAIMAEELDDDIKQLMAVTEKVKY